MLLAGRLVAISLDLVAQVLVVRYLTKDDFGAFAFALAAVSIASSFTALGLDKAVARFVPIYEEQGQHGKVIGSLVLGGATMLIVGGTLIALLHAAHALGAEFDEPGTGVLLILVLLVPIQAIQPLFTALFAAFGNSRAIFVRSYVLAPITQLAIVGGVIFADGDLNMLAIGWVAAGAIGVAVSVPIAFRMLRRRGYLERNLLRDAPLPAREVYAFSVPLMSSDLVLILRGSLVPLLLAALASTTEVAEFRAVFPHARINLIVLQSFTFLFLPHAARLFSRGDGAGLQEMYWQSSAWVALMTFPIFAATFALAPAVVDFLYGPRYADSALIMAMLAVGFFVYATLGFSGLTLRAAGRVRFVFTVDISTGLLSVAAYLAVIPTLGATGAAAVTAGTLVAQASLYQLGARRSMSISVFNRQYAYVYGSVALGAGALLAFQLILSPPLWLGLALAVGTSLLLVRLHRDTLEVVSAFPELARVPLLRRLLKLPARS